MSGEIQFNVNQGRVMRIKEVDFQYREMYKFRENIDELYFNTSLFTILLELVETSGSSEVLLTLNEIVEMHQKLVDERTE